LSRPKLIKTYLSTTLAWKQLTGLAILPIQNGTDSATGVFRNLGFIQFHKKQREIFSG
jgi:hypothetical protein